MSKRLVFLVEDPVFKTEPLFVIGCSFEECQAYVKRRGGHSMGDNIGQLGQMCTFEKPPLRLVWTKTRRLPIVLHEVFHLVTRILSDKGVPIRAHNELGESADETGAYLFEFFAERVIEKLR